MSDPRQNPSAVLVTSFTGTTGGMMTVDAGAITGELELLTRPIDSGIEAQVRYVGARDLYTVIGSPVRTTGAHQEVHKTILQRLTTPGSVEAGNDIPVDLISAWRRNSSEQPCF